MALLKLLHLHCTSGALPFDGRLCSQRLPLLSLPTGGARRLPPGPSSSPGGLQAYSRVCPSSDSPSDGELLRPCFSSRLRLSSPTPIPAPGLASVHRRSSTRRLMARGRIKIRACVARLPRACRTQLHRRVPSSTNVVVVAVGLLFSLPAVATLAFMQCGRRRGGGGIKVQDPTVL
jgi:hypothetical protein